MFDQAYRELACKLDSIPPGFPATESGVELQLLARLYTREEATIVSAMRLTYETADNIAIRAAMDPGAANDILDGAVRKGLVRTRTGEKERSFALNPQTAGFAGYELEALRHDAEVAELCERYMQETRGTRRPGGRGIGRQGQPGQQPGLGRRQPGPGQQPGLGRPRGQQRQPQKK